MNDGQLIIVILAILGTATGIVVYYERRHAQLSERIAKIEQWIKDRCNALRAKWPPDKG